MNRALPCLVSVVLGSAACGCAAPSDPERELRALVAAAEQAAEARDASFFRATISASYVDRRGQGHEDLVGLVRGYFLVNAAIEVVNRIDTITLAGDDAATVTLQTAVIGRAQASSLLPADADFYRLELELAKEGDDWRVIGADWSRP
jgi:hypothetical protein